ncbi:hypothetical protein [Pseudophaeobacter leonis]|uniref:hypothetical protein n=1 Tax=Pseudophaeobacter leonis TaxID=1144477 RepID=UPI0030C6AC95
MVGNRIFDQQTLDWLNVEDGVLEWLSALLLLLASGLAVKLSRAMPIKAHRWMHVFMAVVFFVMFGEEISWGQRLLGFSTPEAMAQINVQNEVNLHNSFGYLFDHLFILCFFLWGCVVPLLYWKIPIWRWFQSRLGLPFASAGLSLAMLAATLFQPQLTDTLFGTVSGLRVAELRETLSALCLLLLVVESRRLTSRDHRGCCLAPEPLNPDPVSYGCQSRMALASSAGFLWCSQWSQPGIVTRVRCGAKSSSPSVVSGSSAVSPSPQSKRCGCGTFNLPSGSAGMAMGLPGLATCSGEARYQFSRACIRPGRAHSAF